MQGGAKVLAALCAGITLGGVGVGIAAIPDSGSGVISACMLNRTGAIRVIDYQAGARCTGRETLISWNAQGPSGPAGGAVRTALVDADGTELGELLPQSSAGDGTGEDDVWWVWDGTETIRYFENGLTYPPRFAPIAFASADCSGTGYTLFPLSPRADGQPNLWQVADAGEPDGFAYYEATSAATPSSITALSAIYSGGGPCETTDGGVNVSGWELLLGAKFDRPTPPLTPTVDPG
ncbi:MAG: hypothetical protein RLY45_3 [Actinomycetota bacterium]